MPTDRNDTVPNEFTAANRANWDDRVEPHLRGYRVDRFAAEPERISDVVRDDVPLMAPYLPGGSVDGLRLAHLQCHIGTDTLSWARLGADVTGIDFSSDAVDAARALAAASGLTSRSHFVQSTVDDAADHVEGRFDVVYTGIGALCWLEDLEAWATTIDRLLKPGGLFFVRDGHPVLNAVDFKRTDGDIVIDKPYFGVGEDGTKTPLRYDDDTTYADDEAHVEHSITYEWPHSISEIITPLLRRGLVLLDFQEQRLLPWKALPPMVESGSDYALPSQRDRLPLTFSLAARKPR